MPSLRTVLIILGLCKSQGVNAPFEFLMVRYCQPKTPVNELFERA